MTQHDTDHTAVPAPRRGPVLRYTVIGAAVLLVAGGIVALIALLSGPAPVDYKITATGTGNAQWITPDGSGNLDLATGTATYTVHAGKVAVTVTSTAADGASCRIEDPDGHVVDEQQAKGGATSVTCSTP
jgi:hypothetical protein